MKFLGEAAATTSSATQWILPAILLVLVIGIFILNYYRSKKNQDNMKNMVESLKVGDNVKTYSGLYGKIIEIIETTDGKVAVLETGSDKNKGIFSIDINAIFGTDVKEPVVYDADGNVVNSNPIADKDITVVKTEEVKDDKAKKVKKESTKTESSKKEPKSKKVATEEKIVEKNPTEEKASDEKLIEEKREVKKAEGKKTEAKKAEVKKAEGKKTEAKKVTTEKADEKKTSKK